MGRVRERVKDKRVLLLVKLFLKAGVMSETGHHEDNPTGTPQGGITTPPTQWAMFALRVGVVGVAAGAFSDGDTVADGDLVGSDEDVFDQQPQDALAFFDGGDLGFAVELGEEAFEVGGEREVGVTVDELAIECMDLVA